MDNKEEQLSSLAIDLLKFFENNTPSRKQVELMTSLLSKEILIKNLIFNKKLSKREITCLYLTAKGKNTAETANIMKISTATIKVYRKSIKKKLACKTMAQAVFLGINFGYLVLPDIN